jgi:DNA ligase (NAD+)
MKAYLDWAAEKYYDGEPIMSDEHWDYLAEVHNYNKVGAIPGPGKTIKHLHQLYSLQKFYEDDKLPDLVNLIETPKLDGSAISLTYVAGQLSTAATRGDGKIGEDVTANFKAWPEIPNEIGRLDLIQVVGEIVAPKEIPNSRNYAAGAARLKNSVEFLSRDISFITYTLHLPKGLRNTTYKEDLEQLGAWGFATVALPDLEYLFPTDGKVYRVNSNKDFVTLGYTAKHPRGAYALKNTSDVIAVHTELLDVVWQVGKSGKVTPVAIFEEIDIDGAKINKATLNNAGFIENLDLNIGDTIIVTRAGGIIPKVLGVA